MELEDVSFQFLRDITDGFSEERILGEGAYGTVYKGVTKNGEDVAVKKLKQCSADVNNNQFRNEFYNLRKLKHKNIVQVLGYCYEIEKKPFIMPDGNKVFVDEAYTALCFEYLHNGSLHKYLSDEFCELDWQTRFKIIKGICEGLKYVHEETEEPIYHLDLKPDNILLDKDMVPKIADFGLSTIISRERTWITQNPYGTFGYQPPEYLDNGEISGKFDIFSLGVIIIKIVSGHKGYPKRIEMPPDVFIDQVRKQWRNRLQETCGDFLLEAYCHQVETCTRIALNCVDIDSQKRPDIANIMEKLNEIEIDIGKYTQKGCHKLDSRMTTQDNKMEMRTEQHDIISHDQNTNLRSSPSCNDLESTDALETSSDAVEDFIVGRTEEKWKIMTSLLEGISRKFAILPIHGIGGIGKTTFARLIYNDPKFASYSRVWVDVSQRFDLNKICESIISQIPTKESTQTTHCCLTKLFFGKKILIVLDDLWEENQFQLQELKDMLDHDQCNFQKDKMLVSEVDGSKIVILVTTRSERVAERICMNLEPYKLLLLRNDMCWDIIKQRSGFEDRDDKEQLIGIGQEIAQKCGGVALVALSLGFTLRSLNSDQWIEVKDHDIWSESVSKDFSLPNHVMASLKLSYSYMSQSLKPCFTYCATFPKGYKIFKDDLIYQWISLDFIKPTKLLSNIQLCQKYIMQLLGLSFFQQPVSAKTSEAYYEQAPFFTMHDLVHDLAISVLGDQILDQSKQGNNRGSSCQYALISDFSKPLELCLTSCPGLMALRLLHDFRIKLSSAAFAPASSLQVLDLSMSSLRGLPYSIGQLKQLRYLKAQFIYEIPECITELSNLIYLDLRGSLFSNLPKSIGKLESLMYLDLSICADLSELPVSFRNLENLVHLDLSWCRRISRISESLQSLSRLEHLNLSMSKVWVGLREDLTEALSGLRELKYLNLSRFHGFPSQQALVNLTKLRYLNLQCCLDHGQAAEAEIGSVLECICGLSNLEYLNLGGNDKLHTIPESIGNLRMLHTLDLSGCSNLLRLPASLSAAMKNSLKVLHVSGCSKLDKSTLPQHKNSSCLLPHFVVHAGDDESSSNLWEVEDKHPNLLEISRLENVKSAEEAKRIKLADKHSIKKLHLEWTRDATRSVDDREVLRELEPPNTLEQLTVKGYNNSIGFPSWMMSIATYLPGLAMLVMEDLPSCSVLPPLGQLPNLQILEIRGMGSIRKIDGAFYGGRRRAFPKLHRFSLSHMECLEEWNVTDSSGEDLEFPMLIELTIDCCPLLRVKASSPPGKGGMFISRSDQVLLSFTGGDVSASSSSAITHLHVTCCEAPLSQWSLLRRCPRLTRLEITDCSDLTCDSTDLLRCISSLETLTVQARMGDSTIVALPERLGDITSLTELRIHNCNRIETLPKSIQQLKSLELLQIDGCPGLVEWCKSKENELKLPHVLVKLNGELLSKTRNRSATIPSLRAKNKGDLTRETEDSANTTRDAFGKHMDHPTPVQSGESALSKAKDDENKYEDEASKQQTNVLKLARYFESLTR